jgi:DNA-binding GntR family transcriptional regulator
MSDFERPERIRIADWAYQNIQEAILGQQVAPGAKLSVPAFAQRFGISRSPVREAILRLIQNGLAEEQVQKGAVVATIGPSLLASYYEVRAVLEGLAARLAATRLTPQQLHLLGKVLDEHKQVAGSSRTAFMACDAEFHRIICAAAGNPAVCKHLDQLQVLIRLGMQSTSVQSGPKEAIRDHQLILERLLARDPDGAEKAAKRHITRLRDVLLDHAGGDIVSQDRSESA